MPKAVKTTSTTTSTVGRRRLATSATLLAALGSIGPFAGSAEAAAKVDADKPATIEDYASIDFEPVPGLAESLGNRVEWLAKMGDRYPTLWLGAATMRMTRDEVTAMAAGDHPEAITELMKCIWNLHQKLEAESDIMRSAFLRLMAGCCRAGLV